MIKPENMKDFNTGDLIDIELWAKNNFEEKLNFDIYTYLYDITKEEIINEDEYSLKIDADGSEKYKFQIKVPLEDVDTADEFVVFSKMIDRDEEYCYEQYQEINLNRPEHKVEIKSIKTDADAISCGDIINTDVRIINLGLNNEYDIDIILEIPELNISETSNNHKLEESGGEDTEKEQFTLPIPIDAKEGVYTINAIAKYNGRESKMSEQIDIECSGGVMESIPLEGQKISISTNAIRKLLYLLTTLPLLMGFFLISMYILSKRKKVKIKKGR